MLTFDAHTVPPHFGAYQKYFCAAFVFTTQAAFFATIALIIYAVATLNQYILGFFGIIFLVQIPLKASKRISRFIMDVIQPLKFFSKFEVIHEEEISQNEKCVFGIHPHSVFSLGALGVLHTTLNNQISNMTLLGSRFILNVPVAGALLKLWGVEAVEADNMKRLMREGRSIGLLPGGFEEATVTSRREMRCWIEGRKGFIKYGLEHGYKIRPVIVMQQHQSFMTFQPFLQLRLFLNRLKIPAVLFWNWKTGFFLSPDTKVHLIVGRAINLPLSPSPNTTRQIVEDAHQNYKEEIVRLYNKYKHLNGDIPIRLF